MRILLATTFLNCLTGSELLLFDLARGLKRRGHEITVWLQAPVLSAPLPRLLQQDGVRVTGRLPPEDGVDVVIFQLKETFRIFETAYLAVPRFALCHGPKLPAEIAPRDLVATTHLALTREGFDYLIRNGFADDNFLGYGVDLERFAPVSPLPDRPRRAVVNSKYCNLGLVEAVCARAGLELSAIGIESGRGPFDIDHYSSIVEVCPDGTVVDHNPRV